MTQQIKQTEGSLGYVELIYALSNGLPFAHIKNSGREVRGAFPRLGDGCRGRAQI